MVSKQQFGQKDMNKECNKRSLNTHFSLPSDNRTIQCATTAKGNHVYSNSQLRSFVCGLGTQHIAVSKRQQKVASSSVRRSKCYCNELS